MCVGFLAWGAIIGILLSFAGSWANMMAKANAACDQPKYFPNCDVSSDSDCTGAPADCNPNVNYATTKYGAYCAAAVGMGCLLFIACMFKRIKLAVGCMEEASRCIQDQPSMNFFPIFQFIMTFFFMCVARSYLRAWPNPSPMVPLAPSRPAPFAHPCLPPQVLLDGRIRQHRGFWRHRAQDHPGWTDP